MELEVRDNRKALYFNGLLAALAAALLTAVIFKLNLPHLANYPCALISGFLIGRYFLYRSSAQVPRKFYAGVIGISTFGGSIVGLAVFEVLALGELLGKYGGKLDSSPLDLSIVWQSFTYDFRLDWIQISMTLIAAAAFFVIYLSPIDKRKRNDEPN